MRARASSPLPWLGGLLALYLLVPIVAFVVRLAGGAPASPGLGAALATSLETATIATVVIAVLGTPLAYLLARRRGAIARVLVALLVLPLALPALMSGVLLLYVSARSPSSANCSTASSPTRAPASSSRRSSSPRRS